MSFNKVLTSLAVSTCLFMLSACSGSPSSREVNPKLISSAIVGGAKVISSDLISKTTVAILISSFDRNHVESQYLCTGSLLRSGVILTAAHCVPPSDKHYDTRMYVVFTSDLDNLSDSDIRLVTDQVVHPKFGQSGPMGEDSNDIALLKYPGSFPQGYRAARLLPNDSLLKPKLTVTLAGYGLNDGITKATDNQLRKVDVILGQSFGDTEIILDQSNGKGACHGDSGGPAFVTIKGSLFLWGVISRGLGDDNCNSNGVYTKINSQHEFIDSALIKLGFRP
ncbi:S1 family peptidase [Bdellovibrio svalbardensis]|uniref:trypsin n=1 Tax=Bdellovibrio svalbardensis TaxID=2972972 RepID=A0ABT6DDL7_9BACT|nr:trypsin-like serine protease [Bdellovibrio svalbardensis]MDG0814888.1 trypsin-like serine protease [Bdellovibrio svalbardensis]